MCFGGRRGGIREAKGRSHPLRYERPFSPCRSGEGWRGSLRSYGTGRTNPSNESGMGVWASRKNQLSDGCLDFVKSGRLVAYASLRFLS